MFEAAAGLREEFAQLEQQLADPAIHADLAASRRIGRRYAELTPIVKNLTAHEQLSADLIAARELADEDPTFAEEADAMAAQLAEVYIASRTISLVSTSVAWQLAEGPEACPNVDDDLGILGYWLSSQAPPAMRICHHLHGGMGMDITYPMNRYYSSIKDLTRLLGGPSHRLDLVGV